MKLEITDKGIKVFEPDCWMCGTKEGITNHHTLYFHLNPIKNVEIPLCDKCHKLQHSQDISSLGGYAHKIWKTLEDGMRHIPILKNMIAKKQREMSEVTIGDIIKMRERGRDNKDTSYDKNIINNNVSTPQEKKP